MKVDKTKWKSGSIDEYCIIQLGTRIVRKDVDEGEFPVYGGGGATFTTSTYNRENAILISRFAMSKECTRFVQGKFFLNDSGLTIIPKENRLLFHYLKWHIFAINDKIYSLGKGVAQKNLDMKRFPFLLLNIPPIDEQQAIASELDTIQKIIEDYKAQLADLDVLAQSIFLDTFGDPITNPKGWEKEKISNIVYRTKNINWNNNNGEYQYIDLTSVDRESKSIVNTTIVNRTNAPSRAKQIVYTNDVIFATTRPTQMRSTIITEKFDAQLCSTGYCVLRPNTQKINSNVLFYCLQTEMFKKYLSQKENGAAYPAVTNKIIFDYQIAIPPIYLQTLFAKQIEAIEKQKDLLREQLKDAETLMAERMQYYFS